MRWGIVRKNIIENKLKIIYDQIFSSTLDAEENLDNVDSFSKGDSMAAAHSNVSNSITLYENVEHERR